MRSFFLLFGLLGFVTACAPSVAPSAVSPIAQVVPKATATATVTATATPTVVFETPAAALPIIALPTPMETPAPTLTPMPTPKPTRAPVIPQRGDIIAVTTEGKYIVIRHTGGEEEIDKPTFQAHARNPSVTVDQSFQLIVSDGHRVMNVPLDNSLRSGGTVALGDRKKILIDKMVAVDARGLYAVVVQNHREVLLFEAIDAHHQGVIYTIPENLVGIESIFWGTAPPRDKDILLVLRNTDGKPGIYWLSPGARIHTAPDSVRQECYRAPRLLTDCLMRYNRSLPRDITLVRDNAFHASVVW